MMAKTPAAYFPEASPESDKWTCQGSCRVLLCLSIAMGAVASLMVVNVESLPFPSIIVGGHLGHALLPFQVTAAVQTEPCSTVSQPG